MQAFWAATGIRGHWNRAVAGSYAHVPGCNSCPPGSRLLDSSTPPPPAQHAMQLHAATSKLYPLLWCAFAIKRETTGNLNTSNSSIFSTYVLFDSSNIILCNDYRHLSTTHATKMFYFRFFFTVSELYGHNTKASPVGILANDGFLPGYLAFASL